MVGPFQWQKWKIKMERREGKRRQQKKKYFVAIGNFKQFFWNWPKEAIWGRGWGRGMAFSFSKTKNFGPALFSCSGLL